MGGRRGQANNKTQAIKKDTNKGQDNRSRGGHARNPKPTPKDDPTLIKSKPQIEGHSSGQHQPAKKAKPEQVEEVLRELAKLEDTLNNYEELEMVAEENVKGLIEGIMGKEVKGQGQ